MSGRVASFTVFETGWPELKSSKWSPPTSRETKTACLLSPRSSCQTTHGTVAPPGFSVPAATRGFSASRRATALSVHASSAASVSAQLPKPCAPEVSRTLVWPAVPFQPLESPLLEAESVHVVPAYGLRPDRARRARDGLLHALRDEDLSPRRAVIRDAVVLLPGDPWNWILARDGSSARDRGVLGRAKNVDVEGREVASAGLAGGQPEIGRRVETAGEDVRRPPEGCVRLVPRDPRDRASRTGEVDRRRFGLLGRVDVERRREPLRHPGAVLERTNEDMLPAAGDPLLERRPRHLNLSGREGAAGDVGDARVLARIDRVHRIVVDLHPGGRERQECGVCRGSREQRAGGGERGGHQGHVARAGEIGRAHV